MIRLIQNQKKMCNHSIVVCEHKKLKYCKICQKVYCEDCKKEWSDYCQYYTTTWPNTSGGSGYGGVTYCSGQTYYPGVPVGGWTFPSIN
jgi:hypothetical protein